MKFERYVMKLIEEMLNKLVPSGLVSLSLSIYIYILLTESVHKVKRS
jgi:hypothetical protein